MLNRDFTKSNKDYFNKNRNVLIAIAIFLVIGILMFAFLGMNGNFEVGGYNEFSVTVNEKTTEDYTEHRNAVGNIIDSYGGKFDTVLIYGEGDDTKYVVRYLNDLSGDKIIEINKLVAEKIDVNIDQISSHVHVNGSVSSSDVVYTIAAILIFILIASIFAYARYNGASAISLIISCLLGTLGFISLGAILRLSIGLSYFAMLIILNVMITYFAIELFETMHKSSWLKSEDYATAMSTALKSSKFRMSVVNISLLAIGLMLVLFAPITIKYVAINLMFMAVVVLAVGWYVIPFVWNVFITQCRKREYKVKATQESKKEIN